MTTVSTRSLKAHLSSVLRRVESGERIMVTRRKKVVAALVPCTEAEAHDEETRLQVLAGQGMVSLPKAPSSPRRFEGPRVPARNRSASAMVLEDRR